MSNKPNTPVDTVDVETTPVVEPTAPVEPEEEKVVTGIVEGCQKLNVRKQPKKLSNGDNVLFVIAKGTEVEIDEKGSTKDWYKVTVKPGKTGFCMKKFIKIES